MKRVPFLIKSMQTAISISLLSLCAILSSCGTASNTKVVVDVIPEKVTVVHLPDPEKKAAKMPSSHEIAQTDWVYSIFPELSFSIKEEKQMADGYHIWLEITGVKLRLELPIKVSILKDAPKQVEEHENGHVEICRRVYKNCRDYATAAADAVMGKTFEGMGANRKLALTSALQLAAQDVAAPYRGIVSSEADTVSSRYDLLCEKEEYQDKVGKALEDAFLEVRSEMQSQSKKKEKHVESAPTK